MEPYNYNLVKASHHLHMRALVLLVACLISLHCSGAPGAWGITSRIQVGGDGGWDYLTVQPETHRLFVSHAKQVVVIDLQTKAIIGSIPAAGSHGIALAPELNLGFITNGADGTVTVFDLGSLQAKTKLTVGMGPDAICYESLTKKIFAFNGKSGTASVIDAVQRKVVGEIPLGGRPEFAQADDHGSVFDALEDKSEVVKIDAASQTITARWNLPAESEPSGMAIDPIHQRLFVGCGNKTLSVMDCVSGKIIAILPIGLGVDACAYDSVGHRVFASCGDGTMTVIWQSGPDTYAVSDVVQTKARARTMAFDASTETAYLPDAKFGPLPASTPDHPKPRPPILPGSLEILVISRGK
jgi:YVTN family beta-propeller protein